MGQTVLRVDGLPAAPLDAAAAFHAQHLPEVRAALSSSEAIVLIFPLAGPQHCGWRLAAVQELAREAAPKRVNGVVGSNALAIDELADWLTKAPGITGQLLAV